MVPYGTRMMSKSATCTKKSDVGTLLTYASLRFSGDRLEPDRLTAALLAAPTIAYRKGEVFKRVRGHEVHGRTGLWAISSKGRVESLDLNDHLEYLLTIVFPRNGEDRLAPLHRLMREQGLEADVPCFWHGKPGAAEPAIRADILARFAQVPAEIEPDFDTD